MTTPSRLLCGLAAVFAVSGCATLQFPWDDKVPEASKKNPVVQITCLWEPSEGHDPNGAPCRGFAGQILFLGNKGGMPVKVNSPVMVYVFDDQGTPEQQAVPVHQFNFDAKAWERHLRVSSLGPTYHVFIPYTRPGNHEAVCSIRVKLTNPDGSTLYSDRAEVPLKGRKREESGSNVEVISHYGKRQEAAPVEGPRTTTIPLDGRNPAEPTSREQFDQERANFLLQQFLRDQAAKDMQRAQSSNVINRGVKSERIRWTGDGIERVSPTGRQSLDALLPTTDDVATVTPASKRIKGAALRHPLSDEAAYPVEPQVATAVDDEADAEWQSAESLDGQTSFVDR